MHNLVSIEERPSDEWDTFVYKHPLGTIYHTSQWMNVIEQSFPHITGQIIVIRNSRNEITAGLPVYLVDSWLTGRRLVSAPFATIFDPLVNNATELQFILDSIISLYKKYQCNYVEIRTQKNVSLFDDNKFFKLVKFYKYHYIKLIEPEELKKRFYRTSVRRSITRSLKYDLKFIVSEEKSALKLFYDIYAKTRKRLGLPVQPFNFFINLLQILSKINGISILLAQKNANTIAGVIAFKYKDSFSLEYGGYDLSFNKFYPNHFLYWNAITFAYSEGYKIFDFGRTAANNKGLIDFKSRWGTEVVDLPKFFYPASYSLKDENRDLSLQYRIARKVFKNAPLSIAAILSQWIYKHMG